METIPRRQWTVTCLTVAVVALAIGLGARQDPRAILLNTSPVNVSISSSSWWLANHSLVVTWDINGGIRLSSVFDRLGGRTGTKPGEAFTITLPDKTVVNGSDCRLVGVPTVEVGPAAAGANQSADARSRRISASFTCADNSLALNWRAELLPGADLVTQAVAITRGTGVATANDIGYQPDPSKAAPPVQQTGFKILGGPYLQDPGSTSMTVMWITDGPAAGWVEYGPDERTAQKAIPTEDGLIVAGGRIHKVRIDGLRPDTAYHYRTITRPIIKYGPYKVDYGDIIRGDAQQFRTLSPASRPFSFLVMNDLHERVDFMQAHLQRAASQRYELVFLNGDSLDYLQSDKQIVERSLAPAAAGFARTVPMLFVRGNHETRGQFSRELKNYLALPGGKFYYSLDHGGVHFVVLDTGEDKEDSHWAYSGLTDFDAYRQAESEWLKREVQTPAFRTARFRVLIAHMPFYGNERTRVSGYGPTSCREHFGAILNAAGIDLHIAGHTHRADWVEPAAGANRFPILVGGGSSAGTNTLTRVTVTGDRLEITQTTDDGKALASHTVMARR